MTRTLSLAPQLLTSILLAGSCAAAFAQGASAPMGGTMGGGSDRLSQAMKAGMDSMGQMKMTGDVDKDFAMMMKAHHQQAVEMAKVELADGKSLQIKAMASKMMKDQQKEIAQLEAWLKRHP